MDQYKVPLIKESMHYGALLGLFLMFRYMFWIGAGFSDFLFIYFYYLLNIGTFLLVYIFYFKFKFKNAETSKPRTVIECSLFTIMMFFFASIFEGAIMYAHYQLIHPEFFMTKIVEPTLKAMEMFPFLVKDKTIMENFLTGKSVYIISNFINNIFLGIFFALLMGFIAWNRTKQIK